MTEDKERLLDIRYLRMAKIWAENSYAIRRKVGCIVVKDNMIISDGYNGTPSGFDNECETVSCNLEKETNMCLKYPKSCHYMYISVVKNLNNCKGCGYAKLETKPYVLHAEANAITKLAKTNNSSVGATIYVTLSPCLECAKLIVQSGIKRVVYMEEYRITDGIDFLRAVGVALTHISEEEVMNYEN